MGENYAKKTIDTNSRVDDRRIVGLQEGARATGHM
jgi:hypothetical protein